MKGLLTRDSQKSGIYPKVPIASNIAYNSLVTVLALTGGQRSRVKRSRGARRDTFNHVRHPGPAGAGRPCMLELALAIGSGWNASNHKTSSEEIEVCIPSAELHQAPAHV